MFFEMDVEWWFSVYAKCADDYILIKSYNSFSQARLAKRILNAEIEVIDNMGYQFDDIKNCSYVIKKSKRKKNSLVEENLRDIVLKNEFIEFEKKLSKELGISIIQLQKEKSREIKELVP